MIGNNDPSIAKKHLDPDSDDEVHITEDDMVEDISDAVILLNQIGLCKSPLPSYDFD